MKLNIDALKQFCKSGKKRLFFYSGSGLLLLVVCCTIFIGGKNDDTEANAVKLATKSNRKLPKSTMAESHKGCDQLGMPPDTALLTGTPKEPISEGKVDLEINVLGRGWGNESLGSVPSVKHFPYR